MVTHSRWAYRLRFVAIGAALISVAGFAQEKVMPDAQVESNVLKALAAAPELADQSIGTTTVYGTVTITGSVRDEASRTKAEQIVSTTSGVKKVVDELVIGTPVSPDTTQAAPAADSQGPDPADQNSAIDPNMQASSPGAGPAAPTAPPQQFPQNQPAPGYEAQSYPQQQRGGNGYPPVYRQPQIYRAQEPGQAVTLPAGAYLRVRINQAMDSRHTQPGAVFDGVVINDIVLGGMVAVPRGAMVQGQVVATNPAGDLKGGGALALQLTQITLEAHTYPLATEPWSHLGYSKTRQTVGTTVGLGAVGAMIGAVAGGGPGALLGAGIGGVAGLGVSSASHSGDAAMPSEAIVNFRLSQQTAINTVSQAELERLAATMPPSDGPSGPPQIRRRAYPPSPYGPVAYPYGYPAPYYYPYSRYYR